MKIYIIFLVAFICEISAKVLPDYIPQCKRKDQNFAGCVISAVEKVKPHLLRGIPEINVPKYEPLEIPKLIIDRQLESMQVKAVLENMIVYGFSSFKIKKLKINLNKYSAEVSVSFPKLQMKSEYDVSGRLLLIPLAGKGSLQGNLTDCSGDVKGSAKIIKKKGIEYLRIENLKSKIRIGGGRFDFIDKDGTNRLIAEAAEVFFNANPRLVLDIVNPIVEDTADVILTAFANKIFGSIPLNELIVE